VEEGTVDDIFERPQHPYTIGLIHAVPRLDLPRAEELFTIEGEPPLMSAIPEDACAFLPRCKRAGKPCGTSLPALREMAAGHRCACHYAGETGEAERGAIRRLQPKTRFRTISKTSWPSMT